METALVIVDMQGYFETANHEGTIRNCIKQIKKAITEKIPIIVLEYTQDDDELGPTLPRLKRHLDKYELTRYVEKYNDDGSIEVIECLEDNDWDIETLRVCGVNITACVSETVYTLIHKYDKQIQIIKNACNGQRRSKKACFESQSYLYKGKNIVLV